jgi:hypothetical protein
MLRALSCSLPPCSKAGLAFWWILGSEFILLGTNDFYMILTIVRYCFLLLKGRFLEASQLLRFLHVLDNPLESM